MIVHSVDVQCRCHIFSILKNDIITLLDSDSFKEYKNRSESIFMNDMSFCFSSDDLSLLIRDSGIHKVEFTWNLKKNLVENLVVYSNMKLIESMNKYLLDMGGDIDKDLFSLFNRTQLKLIVDRDDYKLDSLTYFLPFSFIRYTIDFSNYSNNLCLYSFSNNDLTNSYTYKLFPYWRDYLDKHLHFKVMNDNIYLPLTIYLLNDTYDKNIGDFEKLICLDRLYNLKYKLTVWIDDSTYQRFIDLISSMRGRRLGDVTLHLAGNKSIYQSSLGILNTYFNSVSIV